VKVNENQFDVRFGNVVGNATAGSLMNDNVRRTLLPAMSRP